MIIAINISVFVLLAVSFSMLTSWMWEVGVQEILIYTENFLLEEAKKVRVQILPEITSPKLWDKLELLLYYSGIRNYFPFVSAKVWLMFCFIIFSCSFILVAFMSKVVWKAVLFCGLLGVFMVQLLSWMRHRNMRATERQLLEMINITESFAATADEPLAILKNSSTYMSGPVGYALGSIQRHLEQGWSGRMVLEQLKIMLEHPKWQEFIHNLNVCSMYNSDFNYVFRSSRKSIQFYLSSKKERQSVKYTAQMEMGLIVFLSLIIVVVMGDFLALTIFELMWGTPFGKVCTVYMAGIVVLFYWKTGSYEKE